MQVPVLVANDNAAVPCKTIIASVDPGHKDDVENKINHAIVAEARKVAARFGSDLYLAHAYPSELSAMDSEHVLLSGLPTSSALETLAIEKHADLMVLDVHSRFSIGEFFLGNTAERLLSSLQCNAMRWHVMHRNDRVG